MVGEVFIVIGYCRNSCWDRSHRHQGFWLYLFLIDILIQRHFPFLYLIVLIVIRYYWIPWSPIWIVIYHDALIPFVCLVIYFPGTKLLQRLLERTQADPRLRYIVFHASWFDYSRTGYVVVSFCSIVVTYIAEEQAVSALIENSW